jgi:hypothetical protein
MAAWEACGEAVGGLTADFVGMAGSATWVDDVLDVSFPAEATTAVAFLARPEMVAALNRALSEGAGRPLRHRIRQEPKAAVKTGAVGADRSGTAPTPVPAATGRSQAALLRDTLDHPLVVQARSLFDAAIRKVDQGRARGAAVASTAPSEPLSMPSGDSAPLPDEDELDHAAGDVEHV